MKPFPKDRQEYHPPGHREWLAARFAALKTDVELRLGSTNPAKDQRKGFGTVHTGRQHRGVSIVLSGWHWPHAWAETYNPSLKAYRFADDPVGAKATDSLATRMRVATAFAEAANAFFSDISDSDFVARPIEVVSAADGRPPGIHPGEDGDLLVVNLMLDLTSPRIIDRLVRDDFERSHAKEQPTVLESLQLDIWHQVMRLNAARAMLAPGARAVHLPDRSSLRRRLDALEDEYHGPCTNPS